MQKKSSYGNGIERIKVTFIFHMTVASKVIACSSKLCKWTNMRNPLRASDSSSNLMDIEILTWPHGDIGNGGQNILEDMNHNVALNSQFCQEYHSICVCGCRKKEGNTEANHLQHWKIKADYWCTASKFGDIWNLFQLRKIARLMELYIYK